MRQIRRFQDRGRRVQLPRVTRRLWRQPFGRLVVAVDAANLRVPLSRAGMRLDYEQLARWCRRHADDVELHVFVAGVPRRSASTSSDGVGVRIHTMDMSAYGTNVDVYLTIWATAMLPRLRPDAFLLVSGDGDFSPLMSFARALPDSSGSNMRVGCLGLTGSISGRLGRIVAPHVGAIGRDMVRALEPNHVR